MKEQFVLKELLCSTPVCHRNVITAGVSAITMLIANVVAVILQWSSQLASREIESQHRPLPPATHLQCTTEIQTI